MDLEILDNNLINLETYSYRIILMVQDQDINHPDEAAVAADHQVKAAEVQVAEEEAEAEAPTIEEDVSTKLRQRDKLLLQEQEIVILQHLPLALDHMEEEKMMEVGHDLLKVLSIHLVKHQHKEIES